jgi:NADP-dependent 3-hydroxy acid dehydrogenase YdfG
MARILITGAAAGLGHSAATELLNQGHEVVVHARDESRLRAIDSLLARGTPVVGDLSDLDQVRQLVEQVRGLGRMHAVTHNAGVYTGSDLVTVNVLAPSCSPRSRNVPYVWCI